MTKIVGIGLNKTGTKTLKQCMRRWKRKHMSYSMPAFDLWRNRDYAALMRWVDAYDSFEDWPWPLVFKEIDRAFPGSKFILTRRISAEVWYESLCQHAERTGPTEFRKYIYGFEMPQGHKREHIAFYEQHLQSVRDHFRNRPDDLLEVCWEEGDGWDDLSSFLGFPRPRIAFPHANKSPT